MDYRWCRDKNTKKSLKKGGRVTGLLMTTEKEKLSKEEEENRGYVVRGGGLLGHQEEPRTGRKKEKNA